MGVFTATWAPMQAVFFLTIAIGAVWGLKLRVRTPSSEADRDEVNFFVLEGQTFEAECYPEDDFEFPPGMQNYSIQFLKRGIPYMVKPMWIDDAMELGSDSLLISGNDQLHPHVAELAGDRIRVIRKEHHIDDYSVPKYVLSVVDARPEDTADLECYLLEDAHDPLVDPYSPGVYISSEEWGRRVHVLGDIQSIEMFTYELVDRVLGADSRREEYPVESLQTLENGASLRLQPGELFPDIACRLTYPSYYPNVHVLLKNKHGELHKNMTKDFHRFHLFQSHLVSQTGPLIKMEFKQDYIMQQSRIPASQQIRVNASHHGLLLWCEAMVISPKGHGLGLHAHHIVLEVEGMAVEEEEKSDEKEELDDPDVVAIPTEDVDEPTDSEKKPSVPKYDMDRDPQDPQPRDSPDPSEVLVGPSPTGPTGNNAASHLYSIPPLIIAMYLCSMWG